MCFPLQKIIKDARNTALTAQSYEAFCTQRPKWLNNSTYIAP